MKKQTNGHRWTEEELRHLIAMWLDDVDIDTIASELSVTKIAVYKQTSRMRKEGIPLPRKTNGHVVGRRNQPWTQEEVEYLVRRRNDGITAESIAIELDRSFLAVQGMIATLRKEGVAVKMMGQGVRRKWNPSTLINAIAGRNLIPDELRIVA